MLIYVYIWEILYVQPFERELQSRRRFYLEISSKAKCGHAGIFFFFSVLVASHGGASFATSASCRRAETRTRHPWCSYILAYACYTAVVGLDREVARHQLIFPGRGSKAAGWPGRFRRKCTMILHRCRWIESVGLFSGLASVATWWRSGSGSGGNADAARYGTHTASHANRFSAHLLNQQRVGWACATERWPPQACLVVPRPRGRVGWEAEQRQTGRREAGKLWPRPTDPQDNSINNISNRRDSSAFVEEHIGINENYRLVFLKSGSLDCEPAAKGF